LLETLNSYTSGALPVHHQGVH